MLSLRRRWFGSPPCSRNRYNVYSQVNMETFCSLLLAMGTVGETILVAGGDSMGCDRHRSGFLDMAENLKSLYACKAIHSYGHNEWPKSEVLDEYVASSRETDRLCR